jgi:Zn-dependent protease
MLILVMAYMAISGGRFKSPIDWLTSTMMLLPAILTAISFHEFAHAFVAYKLGDNTPKFQKRVTLNPAAHLDPFGLLCLVFIGFGWGKPVMVDPRNFSSPRRDELFVSLAGVAMNLILAFAFGVILALYVKMAPAIVYTFIGSTIANIIIITIRINLVLMVFNLIPVPPLDGFNVVSAIFDIKHTELYNKIYQNGMFILLVLIIFNIVDIILRHTVNPMYELILRIFLYKW